MRWLKYVLLLFLGASAFAQHQTNCISSTTGQEIACPPITSSGGTLQISNTVLGMNGTFEEKVSGAPATVSITAQGCMTGGTCDTAFNTNTVVGNTNIGAAPTAKPYTYFLFTATWTGGTNVSVQVNPAITTARGGGASYTGSAPIVVSGFNVSCPTCGTGGGTISGVTAGTGLTGGGTTGNVTVSALPNAVNALGQFGASIVEQTQAAATAAAGNSGGVFIPAGNYTTSDCSTWQSGGDGSTAGVIIPSNVWIQGAGQGKTVITINRTSSDPACELFYAGTGVPGPHVSNLTIVWNDNLSSVINTVSTPITFDCAQCEVDHVTFTTTGLAPDRDLELHGVSEVNVHDNIFLTKTGTDGATGTSAVGADAGNTPYPSTGGSFHDNQIIETAANGTPGSLLVITLPNFAVRNNIFDLTLSSPNNVNPVEIGEDANGNMVVGLDFAGNTVRCQECSVFGSLSNSNYTGNHFYGTTAAGAGIYFSDQSNTTVNTTGAIIANNDFHKGSINLGAVVSTGTYMGRILVDHNDITDGTIVCNTPDTSVTFNTVRYGQPGVDSGAITCNSAAEVYGNVVKNAEAYAASPGAQAIYIGGTPNIVTSNLVVDDQLADVAGTVCSVASTSSTTCTGTATSWVHVTGSTWALGSTNRCLFIAGTCDPISGFPVASYIQLDTPTAIAASTAYVLRHTTYNGYEFNATSIAQFNNNIAAGTFNGSAAQFDQTPTGVLRAGNSFDNGTVLNSGGILNLGSSNATVSQAGVLTVASCTGCSGSQIYPGAGIANSTGSAWGTSYSSTNTIPANFVSTLNQNTTGTASNVSGTPALPNGTTATTQTASDNSTKIQTTAGTYGVINTGFGLYRCATCVLAADNIFQQSGNGGLYVSDSSYTSQSNFAGKYMGNNGGGAVFYDIAYNTGSGGSTPLTSVLLGGWSGITTNLVDGSTTMIAGDGSGDATLQNIPLLQNTPATSDSSKKIIDSAWVNNLFAAPPAIGSTTPAVGTFTTIGASSGFGPSFTATDTGSANAYAIAPSPALTAYAVGVTLWLHPANANSGASTINVSGLGVKSITKYGTNALVNGDLTTAGYYLLVYDGTEFVTTSNQLGCANCVQSSQVGAVFSVSAASITGISNDFLQAMKADHALTVKNIIGSAAALTCTTNPTITFFDCGASTTCSGPTTIGTVTVTAANTITSGTVSNAAIANGDLLAAEVTAGSCATLNNLSASMAY